MKRVYVLLIVIVNMCLDITQAVSYTDMDMGLYSSRLFYYLKRGTLEQFKNVIKDVEKEERAQEKMRQLFEYADDMGDCLLHAAIKREDPQFLAYVLDRFVNTYKCDVNIKTSYEYSPLYIAASRNKYVAIQLLHDAGACINWLGKRKETLLHVAALHNSYDAIRILLGLGLKANIQDEGGTTLMDIAIAKNDYDLARIVRVCSKLSWWKKQSFLHRARCRNRLNIIELLKAPEVH